jgi:hypothetical protein
VKLRTDFQTNKRTGRPDGDRASFQIEKLLLNKLKWERKATAFLSHKAASEKILSDRVAAGARGRAIRGLANHTTLVREELALTGRR